MLKHILTTSGAALALTIAVPLTTHAQLAQPNQPPTAISGTSSQPPTGAATGTTDRQGQTGRPLEPSSTQQPPRNDVAGDQPARATTGNPTGTVGVADPGPRSSARRLPDTASALPFIALGAIVVLALGAAIRLGVNSID